MFDIYVVFMVNLCGELFDQSDHIAVVDYVGKVIYFDF